MFVVVIFFLCYTSFFLFFFFFNLVLLNGQNGPRYQRVLAFCFVVVFNRGNAKGTNSLKIVFDVCVCFVVSKFVSGLTLWFGETL